MKHESYPFDWMVSRLPIIQDCIDTKFAYFIDPKYYIQKQTHTTHYHEGTTPVPMKICDETIYENIYYKNNQNNQNNQKYTTRIPEPLSIENGDTYAHLLAMNHRNIYTQETREYYERCIARFWERWDNPGPNPTVGIYIHPTITEKEYAEQSSHLVAEFREFYEKTMPQHWSALFFLMVRTTHPYPITNHIPEFIQTIYTNNTNKTPNSFELRSTEFPRTPTLRYGVLTDTPNTPNTPDRYIRIHVVYTNRDFVDAGEIFMHNAYIETDKMCELLREP
jgi:hypothetical protein